MSILSLVYESDIKEVPGKYTLFEITFPLSLGRNLFISFFIKGIHFVMGNFHNFDHGWTIVKPPTQLLPQNIKTYFIR